MIDIVLNTTQMTQAEAEAEATLLNAETPGHVAMKSKAGAWGVVVLVHDSDGKRVDRWVRW